ncbi:MAG: hypothetical protein OJK14_16365 [Achromobacter sp.]|uniref:hypothetical protein n=1 Tax=Achromobacter sp. TaxID=134375 RepID=UPI002585D83C|nr:hypothetical protein [Achromobacter sp.]MCW0208671.1 hypothetical protein [Achromobacter sp.]
MSAINQNRAAAGRAGRAASPWNRSAHATSVRARLSFKAYCERGQRTPAPAGAEGMTARQEAQP